MNYRFSSLPRIARVLIVAAAVSTIFFCGYIVGDFLHSCPYPAPLGRTDGDVTRTLNAALPDGVSLDSAFTYLSGRGIEFGIERSTKALQISYAKDSNFVGGPVVQAIQRNVAHSLFISTDIQARLYFDSSGRLARRNIRSLFTGP
jgi:hypothetical protein